MLVVLGLLRGSQIVPVHFVYDDGTAIVQDVPNVLQNLANIFQMVKGVGYGYCVEPVVCCLEVVVYRRSNE